LHFGRRDSAGGLDGLQIMTAPRLRIIFAVGLVLSLAGMAACDAWTREWKTCAIGLTFAVGNVLIFLVR